MLYEVITHHKLQRVPHGIADKHIAEGVRDITGTHSHRGSGRANKRQLRQDIDERSSLVLDKKINDQNQAGHRQHEYFGAGDAQFGQNKLHFCKRHSGYQLLNLAYGDVTQQLIYRAVHNLRERLRIQAHAKCAKCQSYNFV